METELEKAAKLHAGIPINRIIDKEERYYSSGIREYDSFKTGVSWQAERSYSRDQTITLLKRFYMEIAKYPNTEKSVDEWIAENLKQ